MERETESEPNIFAKRGRERKRESERVCVCVPQKLSPLRLSNSGSSKLPKDVM